jgi:DNA repair protein RadD
MGHQAVLLVLPTGSGKTVIFCYITERTAAKGNSVIILVHRQELLDQASDHLDRLGVPHGLIAAGRTMTGDLIQIASVDTLVRRLKRVRQPALLIIDEAHHTNAATWRTIIEAWPGARLLGVTATPMRMDGTGLGKISDGYFDTLIEGPSIEDLTKMGYLSELKIYAPDIGIDLDGINIKYGDFDKKQLTHRLDKPSITGNAIEMYQRYCAGVPAIAFCATVDHANHVAEQFNAAGIPAASVDGTLARGVRKYRISALGNGQIKVLTSCNLISEGTDVPIVGAGIGLRPTWSLGLYMQQIGRILRPYPGKRYSIWLDHVDNWLRHGRPDDPRSWSLSGFKKKRQQLEEDCEEIKWRRCLKCKAIFSIILPHCPQCGQHYAIAKLRSRDIKQVDGNLVEITREQMDQVRWQRRREIGMAQSLEELVQIGKQRGYHPFWADRIWNARKMKRRTGQSEYRQMEMAV